MHAVAGHHEVIQDAHVDQRQRLHQRAGQGEIRFAGVGHAGRMVVGQQHAGRVVGQRFAHNLARVDAGVRQSSTTLE